MWQFILCTAKNVTWENLIDFQNFKVVLYNVKYLTGQKKKSPTKKYPV